MSVRICEAITGGYALEVRRLLGSYKVLNYGKVRISQHAHVSIAPWLLGNPFYQVVSVLLLLNIKKVILSL